MPTYLLWLPFWCTREVAKAILDFYRANGPQELIVICVTFYSWLFVLVMKKMKKLLILLAVAHWDLNILVSISYWSRLYFLFFYSLLEQWEFSKICPLCIFWSMQQLLTRKQTDHFSHWFCGIITHIRCWENTRKACPNVVFECLFVFFFLPLSSIIYFPFSKRFLLKIVACDFCWLAVQTLFSSTEPSNVSSIIWKLCCCGMNIKLHGFKTSKVFVLCFTVYRFIVYMTQTKWLM